MNETFFNFSNGYIEYRIWEKLEASIRNFEYTQSKVPHNSSCTQKIQDVWLHLWIIIGLFSSKILCSWDYGFERWGICLCLNWMHFVPKNSVGLNDVHFSWNNNNMQIYSKNNENKW